FICCMLGAGVFCLLGNYTWRERGMFLLIMAVGILTSLLLGAAVGAGSSSQMAATSVTVPVMLLFSFLPMLSMFNDTISRVAKYTYTEQIRLLLQALETGESAPAGIAIIVINILLFGGAFAVLYCKIFT
ncbi:MAG: ABC transporter permease, partial [Acetatifactor sp.]|nr:ABC transporter permease [Acetatifactor sp.]